MKILKSWIVSLFLPAVAGFVVAEPPSRENLLLNPSFGEGELKARANGGYACSGWLVHLQKDSAPESALACVIEKGQGPDGADVLKVELNDEKAIVWIDQARREITEGRNYELSFLYQADPMDKIKLRARFFWFGPDYENLIPKLGKNAHQWLMGLNGKEEKAGWQKVVRPISAPAEARFFSISIVAEKMKSLRLARIQVKESGTAGNATLKVGDKTLFYKPRKEQPDPPMQSRTAEQEELGYVTFARKRVRDVYPDSIPQPDEMTKEIRLFAAPGQREAGWLAVHALRDLGSVKVDAGDFIADQAKGGRISKNHAECRVVKCWKQTCDGVYENINNTYGIIPELLLRQEQFDLSAGRTQNLCFLVQVPEDAKPGDYSAEVRLGGGEKTGQFKIRLKVLPFQLRKPQPGEMVWLIHTTGEFGALMKPGQTPVDAVETALRDLHARGIEGLALGCGYGEPAEYEKSGEGLKLKKFSKLDRVVKAMKRTGMRGPLFVHCGDMLERRVAAALKLEMPPGDNKGGVIDAMKTEEFKTGFKQALLEIDRFIKAELGADFEWFYGGMDEPGSHAYRQERVFWQYQLAKEAGLRRWSYMDGEFWKKLAPLNDVQIMQFRGISADAEKRAQFKRELEGFKNNFYCYGGSGTYGIATGDTLPNRWATGFFSYQTGVKGEQSWLYHLKNPVDLDGTGHCSFYPLISYADKSQELIPTLQLEGIRQGIDDYCYFYTLKQLLDPASETGKTSKVGQIRADFSKLLAAIPLERKQFEAGWNDAELAKVRWQVACWIMELTKTA
ncbi:MAG: hypothetical protein PHV34_14340 [Verrucomicrobiae bacterium]|nr:hypothetical protein [Verrucomicrobiae bacterium]